MTKDHLQIVFLVVAILGGAAGFGFIPRIGDVQTTAQAAVEHTGLSTEITEVRSECRYTYENVKEEMDRRHAELVNLLKEIIQKL